MPLSSTDAALIVNTPLDALGFTLASRSQWFARPFTYVQDQHSDRYGFVARGAGFIHQYNEATQGNTTTNLCGSASFRKRQWSFKTHAGVSASATTVYDYIENGEPNEDGGKAFSIQIVESASTGTPTAADWKYLTDRTRELREIDDEGVDRRIGSGSLSLPVTGKSLVATVKQWGALSMATHQRSANLSISMTAYAALADAEDGIYSEASGLILYLRGDLTQDLDASGSFPGLTGWDAPYRGHFDLTTRNSAPRIIDNEVGSNSKSGLACYKYGKVEILLEDEIAENRWRDQFGKFDVSDPTTFAGVGWGAAPAGFGDLGLGVLIRDEDLPGQDAEAQFLTADGNSYRVTVAGGYFEWEGDDYVGHVVTSTDHDISLENPATQSPALVPETVVTMWISRIQRLDGATYVDVTDSVTAAATPGPGVGVLVLVRQRFGERWGFTMLYDEQDDLPLEEREVVPIQNQKRWARKRLRARVKASSA